MTHLRGQIVVLPASRARALPAVDFIDYKRDEKYPDHLAGAF